MLNDNEKFKVREGKRGANGEIKAKNVQVLISFITGN
jgi:hypothetical protein